MADRLYPDGRREIIFKAFRDPDFVSAAICVGMEADRTLSIVEFYSAHLGIVRFRPGSGYGLAHGWDNAEGRQMSARYGELSSLLNGAVHGQELDIADTVMARMPQDPVTSLLTVQLLVPECAATVPVELLGESVETMAEPPAWRPRGEAPPPAPSFVPDLLGPEPSLA